MDRLTAFLADAAGRPFEWGCFDCSLLVARWIEAARGLHPADDLYGAYETEMGAMRQVEKAGGLSSLFRPRLAALGLAETTIPRPGDVAVVELPGLGAFGAIRAASGWAVKTSRGLVISEAFRPLVVWSV